MCCQGEAHKRRTSHRKWLTFILVAEEVFAVCCLQSAASSVMQCVSSQQCVCDGMDVHAYDA